VVPKDQEEIPCFQIFGLVKHTGLTPLGEAAVIGRILLVAECLEGCQGVLDCDMLCLRVSDHSSIVREW